jgi:hypothetical protein
LGHVSKFLFPDGNAASFSSEEQIVIIMPSNSALLPGRLCIVILATIPLMAVEAPAQSPLIKAVVRNLNLEVDATDPSRIHVNFRVVDDSFDETGCQAM